MKDVNTGSNKVVDEYIVDFITNLVKVVLNHRPVYTMNLNVGCLGQVVRWIINDNTLLQGAVFEELGVA